MEKENKMAEIWKAIGFNILGIITLFLIVGIISTAWTYFSTSWKHVNQPEKNPHEMLYKMTMYNDYEKGYQITVRALDDKGQPIVAHVDTFSRALTEEEVKAITAWYEQKQEKEVE